METRANYALIGAFTLAAVVGAFLFVMWIAGYGSSGGHRTYQVVFKGSVAGLSNGATVSFNGIKVGEVTHLTFSRSDTHQVVADIDVSSEAPIDRNTRARLETQGLTGGAVVALLGGATAGQPLVGENGRPATIYAIDPEQIRAIVGNVQAMSAKGVSVIDRADKLLADNSDSVQSTLRNADVFAKALADSAPNIDVTLKNLAELSKTVQPVVAQIQSLSQDADRVIKAVEPDQIHALIGNAQTFSQALAESSQNFEALARNGALLATHLNEETSKRLDTALDDVNDLAKAIDSQKIASIVDSANDVAQTVRQNRGNIDSTLKNFSDMSAKLNESADKVDGVLTSAQSFLGSPSTKGAVDHISDAALSIKRLADDVDSRVKDIAGGLSRFTNSGLREYEALAVEGRRAVADIDRVVRSLGNNPSQVLFGSRPALPEYHGGQ